MSLDALTKRLASLEEKMAPKLLRKVYRCTARAGHADEDLDAYFAGLGIKRPRDDSEDLTIVRVIVSTPIHADATMPKTPAYD